LLKQNYHMEENINHTLSLLHSQELGSVSICEGCNEINLIIKDTCVFMSFSDFKILAISILNSRLKNEIRIGHMVIKIPNQTIFIRLNYREYNELFELINIVKLLLNAKQIINNVY